jgi:hypothetical protein
MRNFLLIITAALASCGEMTAGSVGTEGAVENSNVNPPVNGTIPSGVFYLPSGQNINPAALEMSDVDGVVVGAFWKDLEPTEGNYVFDSLESMLSVVEASNGGRGKIMRLGIGTGGGDESNGGEQPDWLYARISNDNYTGGKFFTFISSGVQQSGQKVTIPVFWEPTLLAKKAALLQAVANYLGNRHPLIKVIWVAYCDALTNDWNPGSISDQPDGLGSNPQQRWLNTIPGSGYQTFADALTAAGNAAFAATHAALPNLVMATSIGRIDDHGYLLNPDGANVYGRNISESVVNTASSNWPGLVVAMKANLNGGSVPDAPGGTTAWNDLYRLNVPHAAQNVWKAYGDAACAPDSYKGSRMNAGIGSPCEDSTQLLKQAVDTGVTYATMWQEMYDPDVVNLGANNLDPHIPALIPSNVIHYGHTQLHH